MESNIHSTVYRTAKRGVELAVNVKVGHYVELAPKYGVDEKEGADAVDGNLCRCANFTSKISREAYIVITWN